MIKTKEKLYFAYGSNMNLNQMAFRCPDAEVVESVRLEGYRLAFRTNGGGNGVATILPEEGSYVDGVLWRISERDEQHPIHKIPTREQVELIRRQYPVGTRIILNHMDDSQAPPPGTKGTVAYVDDIGQIGVKWDTGSSLSLIPGVDSFSKEPAPEKAKHKRSSSLER